MGLGARRAGSFIEQHRDRFVATGFAARRDRVSICDTLIAASPA